MIAFTIAGDEANLVYAHKLKNSLAHFHPDLELKIYGPQYVKSIGDPHFFYRATPMIARNLLEDHDLVIKIDADSVVTGSLDHIIKDDAYDVGCVLNWNRVDPEIYPFPLTVWDINETAYMNCGFVAMRDQRFVNHWWHLCTRPNFVNYRFREQDLLNIIYHYGHYNVKCFDHSDNWHGLISKGEWGNFQLEGERLYLPVIEDYPEEEKTIKLIHWAGGNVPNKMNFDAAFSPEVATHLKKLTEDQ